MNQMNASHFRSALNIEHSTNRDYYVARSLTFLIHFRSNIEGTGKGTVL